MNPQTTRKENDRAADSSADLLESEILLDDSKDSFEEELAPIKPIPVPKPIQWIVTALCIIVAALVLYSVFTNPRFEWPVVAEYFTTSAVLGGLQTTLILTVCIMAIAIALGSVLAVMRVSGNPVAVSVSWLFVFFFRGIPALVQLIFWYNFAALYPELRIGPIEISVNEILTPFIAAVVGLGLYTAAHMAEFIRSGILSVDDGQRMAAQSIGMSDLQIMRRIVIPQSMRVIIPPTANEFISTLKGTAIVSVIATPDLLYTVQQIYAVNYATIPLLIVASLWYLIITTVLSIAQHFIERHFSRGVGMGQPPRSIWARLRWDIFHFRPKKVN